MNDKKSRAPHTREITLNDEDAEAGGDEFSIVGEEDPGSALEDMVEYDKSAPKKKPTDKANSKKD